MKLSEFSFNVPNRLIALEPSQPRSAAKMLVYNRSSLERVHSSFADLPIFLKPGDLLVFNDTFVIPARFFGKKSTGGNFEGLLLQTPPGEAVVWIRGRVNYGDSILIYGFRPVEVRAKDGKRVTLSCERDELVEHLKKTGSIPVPPYIVAERERRSEPASKVEDVSNYQSIFAEEKTGYSVAAPTASLHFDSSLRVALAQHGIETCTITLHVGEGTFAPVEVENIERHRMHREEVHIAEDTWKKIRDTKSRGGRVIAVGTTVCRSLEAASRREKCGESIGAFATDLFIRPPFGFEVVDGLVTNFHWPDSTLIVLVATFLEAMRGECVLIRNHLWRQLYQEAIESNYRLFSYGDGMLIL
jgi:S-adenosylmethionine:tRNA ribosyltransferase-isomerase